MGVGALAGRCTGSSKWSEGRSRRPVERLKGDEKGSKLLEEDTFRVVDEVKPLADDVVNLREQVSNVRKHCDDLSREVRRDFLTVSH